MRVSRANYYSLLMSEFQGDDVISHVTYKRHFKVKITAQLRRRITGEDSAESRHHFQIITGEKSEI